MNDEIRTVFEHSATNRVEGPSKSQKKRDARAIQDLGAELLEQKADFIRDLALPAEIEKALLEGQKMDRGARKRQIKFIGRLLRDIDPEPVQEALASLHADTAEDVRTFHQLEQWRDRLLAEGEAAVAELLAQAPAVDTAELHRILRTAAGAEGEGRKKAGRTLFRFLRRQLAGG
ncbi:MAG TPA: ribosome biogenesis factor YjgA [Mariprofundaceae bacterium]|nr:ribosome biogenesis factor YjgA [Mariprofundaceae bacterium]